MRQDSSTTPIPGAYRVKRTPAGWHVDQRTRNPALDVTVFRGTKDECEQWLQNRKDGKALGAQFT